MKNRIMKSEKGSGLVLALMVLLVLSVLGSALGIVTVGSHKLADINRDSTSAYYIAEAGANLAYEEMENYVLKAYEDSDTPDEFFNNMKTPFGDEMNQETVTYINEFDIQIGNQPKATIMAKMKSDEGDARDARELTLTSIGEISEKTRIVEKSIKLTWHPKGNSGIPIFPVDTAIIFKEFLDLSNGAEVYGDIRYDGKGEYKFSNGAKHYPVTDTEIIIDSTIEWQEYIDYVSNFPMKEPIERKKDSTGNILNVNENIYIPEIEISNGDTLIINTQGKNVYLETDDLILKNSAELKIIGDGNLTIYVNSKMDLANSSKVNLDGVSSQLRILYASSKKINFSNSSKINGMFFIKEADIDIGNSAIVTGGIISGGGSVDLKNSEENNLFIIAPLAKVDIKNSAILFGTIIANSIDMKNSSKVEYSTKFTDYLPGGNPTDRDHDWIMSNLISSTPTIEK